MTVSKFNHMDYRVRVAMGHAAFSGNHFYMSSCNAIELHTDITPRTTCIDYIGKRSDIEQFHAVRGAIKGALDK